MAISTSNSWGLTTGICGCALGGQDNQEYSNSLLGNIGQDVVDLFVIGIVLPGVDVGLPTLGPGWNDGVWVA